MLKIGHIDKPKNVRYKRSERHNQQQTKASKMKLLPVEIIKINQNKIAEIDNIIKSIYRLIIYSRHHLDDDLLDIYLDGV